MQLIKDVKKLSPGPKVIVATSDCLEDGHSCTIFTLWANQPNSAFVLALEPAAVQTMLTPRSCIGHGQVGELIMELPGPPWIDRSTLDSPSTVPSVNSRRFQPNSRARPRVVRGGPMRLGPLHGTPVQELRCLSSPVTWYLC